MPSNIGIAAAKGNFASGSYISSLRRVRSGKEIDPIVALLKQRYYEHVGELTVSLKLIKEELPHKTLRARAQAL
jgi:hypothetical protein